MADDIFAVSQSATKRRWVPRLGPDGERTADALAQRHQLPEIAARILAGRGVTLDGAAHEIDPTIRHLLPDPSTLTDCDRLVARLADAVEAGERIALFADYDVDGATSAAVVAQTLRALGTDVAIRVPDRLTEGYGPSIPAMEAFAEADVSVVVMLDCGAGAVAPVEVAGLMGLTVLVIDHHPVTEVAPAHAVVNPNRADDLSGLGACAAVGVAFVVMVGLMRELRRRGAFATRPEPNLLDLLDCVALGTVADVVPLTALNRAFVRRGLTAIGRRTNRGLAALTAQARIGGPVAAHHLGYVLGPRINAGGRVGDAGLGARLLTSADPVECAHIATILERLNEERRRLEQSALAEAEAMADADAPVIVVAGPWHPGVVGLVASRLKERHRRPAIAIALQGETGTGSGRSIPGVDLGACIRALTAEKVLQKGGGHAMAAGLTVSARTVPALAGLLAERLGEEVVAARAVDALKVDAVAAPGALTLELAQTLERLGPWGAGRPRPLIALAGLVLDSAVPVGSGDTLRCGFRGLTGGTLNAMAFRTAGPLGARLTSARGDALHVAVHLSLGRFRGETRAEIVVEDVADAALSLRRAA